MDHRELTLTDLLADPMILAVMAADRVDPAALEATLSGLARRLELVRPAAEGGCGDTVSGARGGSAFREFLRPAIRAPTDQMLGSARPTTIDTTRRTKPCGSRSY
jgi:hypothetical protein